MQCLILAGGLATRMRPLTETLPKCLLEMAGRPFVDYQVDLLVKNKVDSLVLCVGYLGEQVEKHFEGWQDKWPSLQKVVFVHEGSELRGTGGAIRLAYDQGVLEESFFVIYGDSYLPICFEPIWKEFLQSQKNAQMTVLENAGRWDASNTQFDPHTSRVLAHDKSRGSDPSFRYIDYGLSALRRSLVAERIPANQKVDLSEVFGGLAESSQLGGYEVKERFFETGSFQGLHDFEQYVRSTQI